MSDPGRELLADRSIPDSEGARERSPLLAPTDVSSRDAYRSDWTQGIKQDYLARLDMTPTQQDSLSLLALLTGLGLFVPLTWIMVLSGDLKAMGPFIYHPPAQSLAIACLMLGISPLQPPPSNTSSRQTRFQTHQNFILYLVLPLFAVGTLAMWYNKHIHNAVHFTTWHAWFGLVTVFWMLAQSAMGAASVFEGGKAFGGADKAKKVYKYHRLSGYVLVTLALFTAHLGGAHSTWALGRTGYGFARLLAFWVGIPLVWVGIIGRMRTGKMQFK